MVPLLLALLGAQAAEGFFLVTKAVSTGSLYANRRQSVGEMLGFGGLVVGTATTFSSPQTVAAFDNAIEDYAKYADKPKRRGTPPKDLGVLKRSIEVKNRILPSTQYTLSLTTAHYSTHFPGQGWTRHVFWTEGVRWKPALLQHHWRRRTGGSNHEGWHFKKPSESAPLVHKETHHRLP